MSRSIDSKEQDDRKSKSRSVESEESKKTTSGHDRNERDYSRKKSSKQRSRSSNTAEKGRNTIKLIYKKGHRYVKIVDFVAVSQLIKQHQVTGRVPRSIDLTDYFDSTICIFADYIEKGEVKAQLSFYSLAELLKLTKTFVMEDLQKRLEENLILTAETSTDHLIQAVLVAGTSNITKETENALHYLAAWSFVEMAALPDFQRIPCELQVAHELIVADAALLWLVGQPHPAVYAPGVFSVIRAAYLSKVDRQLIVERIATLQMPESVARFARVSMESRHNSRICLEGTHINRHLCRCGLPDPENRPKETSLSLSRPREGIKWSDKNLEERRETKTRQSKSRSRQSQKERRRTRPRRSQTKERAKAITGKIKNAFSQSREEVTDEESKSRKRRKRRERESESSKGSKERWSREGGSAEPSPHSRERGSRSRKGTSAERGDESRSSKSRSRKHSRD
ncbi:hypothetical protein Q1695_015062 [Nippostrongylus brasiliensis]|nr:hypothetical protein Q1695_015062 [Nippostrongylus brasiliensis]